MVDQVVDDLELTRGAVVAGQAAEERLNEVVHETGEDAGGFGGVELLDFVSPALASDLFERRLEAVEWMGAILSILRGVGWVPRSPVSCGSHAS